jgi:hypothetical protein
MSLFDPFPLERVRLVNPGQQIILSERTLTAWKPPAFDNPSTTGFVDNTSGALICSDCFGALLGAVPQSAADLTLEELRQGQVFWATVDSPWRHNVDPTAFASALHRVRDTEPALILIAHVSTVLGEAHCCNGCRMSGSRS